jgi:hypothetical protein
MKCKLDHIYHAYNPLIIIAWFDLTAPEKSKTIDEPPEGC